MDNEQTKMNQEKVLGKCKENIEEQREREREREREIIFSNDHPLHMSTNM